MPAEGSNRLDHELDNWSNYGTCGWIKNPDPSPTGPRSDSPDLIPDSEPSNSTAASGEETGNNEADLASVPSTVQVGSPGSSGPVRSSGGGPGENRTGARTSGISTTATTTKPLARPPRGTLCF